MAALKRLARVAERSTTKSVLLFDIPRINALENAETIKFKLGGTKYAIQRKEVKIDNEGYLIWKGDFPNDKGRLTLIRDKWGLGGHIVYKNKFYEIMLLAGDKHALIEYQAEPGLDECKISEVPSNAQNNMDILSKGGSRNAVAGKTRIDVLVAYTNRVNANYTINTKITGAVEAAHDSYNNSGVNIELNIVHRVQVGYAEVFNNETNRDRFRSTNDDHMNEIHTLRDQYGADICVLLVDGGSPFGTAYIGPDDWKAFCVVRADKMDEDDYYTFTHEIGHLLNARHEYWADDKGTTNHGWVSDNGGIMTMMSTDYKGGGNIRKKYWSNPYKNYIYDDGSQEAMGHPDTSNNTAMLNSRRYYVANFRTPPPPPPAPQPPAPPANFTIINANVLFANPQMTWSSVSSANEYKVYRRASGSSYWDLIQTTTGTSYTDPMITIEKASNPAATDIYYRVTAANGDGESDPCNEQSVWGDGLYKPDKNTGVQNTKKMLALANFPNPFHPSTNIRFFLPTEGTVVLEFHNTRGQRIETIDLGVLPAGNSDYVWQPEDPGGARLSNGLYFCTLKFRTLNDKIIHVKRLKLSVVR